MGVASCSSTRNSCDEFFSDSCPLYEDAILSFRHTDTAGQCQDLCRNLEACLCCISGPGLDTSDDVDDCLIGCETSTTTAPTTTTTTASTSTTSISTSTTPDLTTTNKPSTITTPTQSTVPTTTTPSKCGDGWYDLAESCYSLLLGTPSLADCNYACYAEGGRMASVHSHQENMFLTQLVKESNRTIACLGGVFQD